jgi:hypothetical protein
MGCGFPARRFVAGADADRRDLHESRGMNEFSDELFRELRPPRFVAAIAGVGS